MFLLSLLLCMGIAEELKSSEMVTQVVDQLGPVQVGKQLPPFGGLTLSGERWTLSATQSTEQYIVVSYMASWCAPCRVGLPIIEKVVSSHPNASAVYVAIGEKSDSAIREMATELHLTQPILWDKFQLFGQRHGVASKGQIVALPKTFVLKPDGQIGTIFVTEGSDFEERLIEALSVEVKQ